MEKSPTEGHTFLTGLIRIKNYFNGKYVTDTLDDMQEKYDDLDTRISTQMRNVAEKNDLQEKYLDKVNAKYAEDFSKEMYALTYDIDRGDLASVPQKAARLLKKTKSVFFAATQKASNESDREKLQELGKLASDSINVVRSLASRRLKEKDVNDRIATADKRSKISLLISKFGIALGALGFGFGIFTHFSAQKPQTQAPTSHPTTNERNIEVENKEKNAQKLQNAEKEIMLDGRQVVVEQQQKTQVKQANSK